LEFTNTLDKNLNNSVMIKQIVRSGTSIGANVHESKGGTSKKDFSHYFSIALKSANETIYWLNLLKDTNSNSTVKAEELLTELEEISKVLAKIVINSRKVFD
jgi:four helix bundle protein